MNKYDIGGLILAMLGGLLAAHIQDVDQRVDVLEEYQASQTVLVGFGCESPSSVAVATEEDLLPKCAEIERHEVARR